MEFDKSKVFTALNADEVKLGSIGYFADDLKTLKDSVNFHSERWHGEVDKIYDTGSTYRFGIKNSTKFALFYLVEEPEEKRFRPYKDADEMVEDFMKRFNVNVPPYEMPLIWIKTKDTDKKYLITRFAFDVTICRNIEVYTPTFKELVEGYTYLDGSPCGIEE